jgi:hypothetical protein
MGKSLRLVNGCWTFNQSSSAGAGGLIMMAAIFAAMSLSLALVWFGWNRLALLALAVAFGLTVYLFQWEIYSPETGFRMPWIQTKLDDAPRGTAS